MIHPIQLYTDGAAVSGVENHSIFRQVDLKFDIPLPYRGIPLVTANCNFRMNPSGAILSQLYQGIRRKVDTKKNISLSFYD